MRRRVSGVIGGVLLLIPTVSRAQATAQVTAGANLAGTWMMEGSAGACGGNSGASKTQYVLALTAADSMASTHCRQWRGGKWSGWGHSDGGSHWRVVGDTLLWWPGEAPDENPFARRCHVELTNDRLNLACKKSSEGISPLPAGAYERADSLSESTAGASGQRVR